MKLIGLSGGIASGKSTIGRRLEELGAVRIDADQLARDVVQPGAPALERIRSAFGEHVIAADGALDREALGSLVFANPDALAELNGIVHPAVRELAQERIAAAEAADPAAIVVYEIPLLVETGAHSDGTVRWDLIVIADAPAEKRERRLVELRGLSEEEAARRIASQADDDERRAAAGVLIDTSGSKEQTLQQVDALWRTLNG
ncbi:dephospho-CoA kinase [Leucobacter soli]|nr:dephospho-CoA kinase [Leucobacter soli]